MKFLAIIPARYASTRFPGKPLADIAGKPMIEHVYLKARSVFPDCYVATDDSRIEEAVKSFGGNAVMTSAAHRSGTDRCREALDKIEALTGNQFDVAVNIQGDEPFVSQAQLELLANCFTAANNEAGHPDAGKTDIATLVKPFTEGEDIFNPNSPKVAVSADGHALYFSRSVIPYLRGEQQASWQSQHTYLKHLGLYAYRSEVLRRITELAPGLLEQCESLEQLRWLENGYRIKVARTTDESIAIDTPEDLRRAVEWLKKG